MDVLANFFFVGHLHNPYFRLQAIRTQSEALPESQNKKSVFFVLNLQIWTSTWWILCVAESQLAKIQQQQHSDPGSSDDDECVPVLHRVPMSEKHLILIGRAGRCLRAPPCGAPLDLVHYKETIIFYVSQCCRCGNFTSINPKITNHCLSIYQNAFLISSKNTNHNSSISSISSLSSLSSIY